MSGKSGVGFEKVVLVKMEAGSTNGHNSTRIALCRDHDTTSILSTARNHQGTLTSKASSAAERVAALMHNAAPAGTDVNSRSPQKKRKNWHNSVSQKRPAPNPIQTAPTVVAVGPSATDDSMSLTDNITAVSNLISQALNFLVTANIKTSHEGRNLETARSQVRAAEQKVEALSAEVADLSSALDKEKADKAEAEQKVEALSAEVANLSSALEKEKTDKAELKRRVTDLEAEKTASVNISYILAVVDVVKRLKEDAPDVDLGFLRDDLKAYVDFYPPPAGVVLGTMDEFLGA